MMIGNWYGRRRAVDLFVTCMPSWWLVSQFINQRRPFSVLQDESLSVDRCMRAIMVEVSYFNTSYRPSLLIMPLLIVSAVWSRKATTDICLSWWPVCDLMYRNPVIASVSVVFFITFRMSRDNCIYVRVFLMCTVSNVDSRQTRVTTDELTFWR